MAIYTFDVSSLDSHSTFADVRAAYQNNASYIEDSSPAKARTFITACRLMIQYLPAKVVKGGNELDLDTSLLADQIADAQKFLTQYNRAAEPVRCYSIENFRD